MRDAHTQIQSRAVFAALLAAFLALLAGAIPLSGAAAFDKKPLAILTASGRHELIVEVAVTPRELEQGLMFRRSMGADEGMIFLYPQPREIAMWMKNTYISLDMVFIRADGTVLRIERGTEPFSERVIKSGGTAAAVVELIAGTADRFSIKPGDKIDYPAFK